MLSRKSPGTRPEHTLHMTPAPGPWLGAHTSVAAAGSTSANFVPMVSDAATSIFIASAPLLFFLLSSKSAPVRIHGLTHLAVKLCDITHTTIVHLAAVLTQIRPLSDSNPATRG